MSSIHDIFGSSYLKAADLIHHGQRKRVTVTIEAVRVREFDGGVKKLELSFRDREKCLICNRINSIAIADQHGEDFEAWPGKTISLYATKCEFQGQRVDAIRVFVPEEAPPPPAAEDGFEEIPF